MAGRLDPAAGSTESSIVRAAAPLGCGRRDHQDAVDQEIVTLGVTAFD